MRTILTFFVVYTIKNKTLLDSLMLNYYKTMKLNMDKIKNFAKIIVLL